ncbi:MAG TPA: capsule assembly Wzi family protein [Acidobacteriaceae bacterium]|nr:capsule assembly Wzi family protein [Acidobacteriaceae bacterium]
MRQSKFAAPSAFVLNFIAVLIAAAPARLLAQQPAAQTMMPSALQPVFLSPEPDSDRGSVFVPFDSWIYPAFERLFSLGYVDSAYMDMRPWTRLSCLHILEETYPRLEDAPGDAEAWSIFQALAKEFGYDVLVSSTRAALDEVYIRPMGIAGPPLNDSFHFGQTIINDDGRPYQEGFNAVGGFVATAESGRFSLEVRGEYQHAPGRAAYPQSVQALFAQIDTTPELPAEPVPQTNVFRLLDANLSFHLFQHEISAGKMEDEWGPARSGGMAISNNAEPMYAFRINRVEPLRIPLLSTFLGPFRYEGLLGDLKGHRYPNAPWIHAEKFSFKPTRNLEFGFSRVVVFAGEGHVPLTFGSFWNSFTSFSNVSVAQKQSRNDPGARHSSFDFTWRLPWLEKWLTLYSDSIVHDDVSPLAAPRRAAVTPGIYLSHVPRLPHVDFRLEAVNTDPVASSQGGQFIYYENVYRDGYLNSGNLFGSWMGREGKGGQAWITDWLSPRTYIQVGYRNAKVSKNFVPGGTTQNDFNVRAVLRLKEDVELRAFGQMEFWKVPALAQGRQKDFTGSFQLTYFPKVGWHR